MQALISIAFDCVDADDAATTITGWTLSPGAEIQNIVITDMSAIITPPVVADGDGRVEANLGERLG